MSEDTPTHSFNGERFALIGKDSPLSIYARQTRAGRWQYRIDSHKGVLVASGVSPDQFVTRYWHGTLAS